VRVPDPHGDPRSPTTPLRLPDGPRRDRSGTRGASMDLTRALPFRTRSISAENPTGEPGNGGRAERGSHSTAHASQDLPLGWKKSPCIDLAAGETRMLADITGPGIIQHIWMTTLPQHWRRVVLSIQWDDADYP